MTNSTIFDLPKLLFVPGYKLIYSVVAVQREHAVERLTYSHCNGLPVLIIWVSPGYGWHIPTNTPTVWSKESVLVGDIGAFHLVPIEPPSTPNLLTIHTTEG